VPRRVVIDSGLCIALFDRDDRHHAAALRFTKQFRGELITSRSVVTEVMFMLSFSVEAQLDFLAWIDEGHVRLSEPKRFERTGELMKKYADRPMDFADGVLVALCEELETKHIATIDDDFTIYRYKGRGKFVNEFFAA